MAVNKSSRKALSVALSVAVSGILLYFALRGVKWDAVGRTIAGAQWGYLAAACGIASGSLFLRAVRWRILLNAEAQLGVFTVFWANMAGYLGNSFLPARAGEVLRSVLIGRRSNVSKTFVLTTALAERLMDAIALVLWSSLILLTVKPKPQWMDDLSRTMAFAAAAGGLCVLVLPHAEGLVHGLLPRIPAPAGMRKKIGELVSQVLLGLRAFHDWRRLGGFVVLTVVIWLADASGIIVSAQALSIELPFRVAMLLIAGLGLGSALPSTPGYVGVYQFVAVSILTPFGVSRDAALAYILVVQAQGYVVTVAYGLPGLYLSRQSGKYKEEDSAGLA